MRQLRQVPIDDLILWIVLIVLAIVAFYLIGSTSKTIGNPWIPY